MREREGKRLVPKEEFEALLHVVSCLALSAGEQRLQINHYYDTIDHGLGKEGVCVRIRQTEGRPLAGTVKKHGKNGISEESSFRVGDSSSLVLSPIKTGSGPIDSAR